MRYLKKLCCFFLVLSLVLAIVPFQTHAAPSFDIVGWREEDYHKAVTSVKVNGVELSKYNPSMYNSQSELSRVTVGANAGVSVVITLADGYALSSEGSGAMLYLLGVQTGETRASSDSADSIQIPSIEADEADQELYLSFKTARVFEDSTPKTINDITLNVLGTMNCGTKINDGADPAANVSVPSDSSGYIIAPDSVWWLKKHYENYVENEYPLTAKKSLIFKVDLLDRGQYLFNENLNENNITINGGKLLDYEMDTFGGPCPTTIAHRLCVTVGIDLEHIAGKAKKEDIVPATCTGFGHHDNVVRCKYCKEELDRVGPITDDPIGHKWGKWKVVKEPTVYEDGIEKRICKHDHSHIQTRTIPRLDSRMVTFDNQGRGVVPEPQRVAVGQNAIEPENMFAKGYVFCGWYIDSACTMPFDFKTPITEDITLYAKWLPSVCGSVGTGDESSALLWSAMLGLILSALAFVMVQKNRKMFEMNF